MCGLGYHEGRRARQGRGRCALSSPSAMPRATTDHHPATRRGPRRPPPTPARWPAGGMIPRDQREVLVALGDRRVKLTNLRKLFWPALGITKGDLIRYYVDLAPVLLPHLRDRAMVMRRYPDGAGGKSFFMKRAPTPRPEWLATCAIEHASGNVIDFPMIQDLAALLWVVNLGCIDLNQWYARCDDVDRPDYLHFDLDPTEGATFAQVLETARAAVSTQVTWAEVERGFAIDDFRLDNVPARVKRRGDLWAPLLAAKGRVDLRRFG